ncbi:conserved hypothetical protein [Neospora caninum Liverpool]|uniref:Uncharacterized protein n=1 Tax=Neospora caninum (strain Liverpool) TaxID=572307 RepID=F0VN36_NEOCL|nr:conserved hypothetical protein [Neospora caninum Liverpool]CBZ55132.1 conserved hypothetical protein [Neospora caninum Liverpool]CEL69858.1 TPA: hypothetical protein BN1204_055570 [Neospora caninum Liverpool]|eukprot:XP_003885160.1 conserved hypothetical protein [Neospora caninum Liverpool]
MSVSTSLSACSTSSSPSGSSSEACMKSFCRRLDEVGEEPRAVGEILVQALLHPSLCFFAELLSHPKITRLRQVSDAPSVFFDVSPSFALGLTELLATVQLFSTGTVEDYRGGRDMQRQGLVPEVSCLEECTSLEAASGHFPALPPVLLRKLRMLTTLTLASYCRELSFATLASLLSVNEEDIFPCAACEWGAATEAGEVGAVRTRRGVHTLEGCDRTDAVSADIQSTVAATAHVSPQEAEAVVRACIAMGWMNARINREKQIAFVEDVLGRDVNDTEDLTIMEEVLDNFAQRVRRAIHVLNDSEDMLLQCERQPSADGSCEATA